MLPHRMPDAPLRVALVGAGTFVRRAHVPALEALSDRISVEVVCARRRERAREVAARFGAATRAVDSVDAVLDDDSVEVALVALPIPLQPAVVRACLAAGRHVISEKPIATDLETARSLVAFHETCGPEWMVAENWRYEACFVEAARRLHAGEIGRPVQAVWSLHVAIRPGHPYHTTSWRRDGGVPGGFLLDAGVHYVAVLRMLFGEPTAVVATTRATREDLPPADTLAALLRFEGDVTVSLSLSFGARDGERSGLLVVGEDGWLRVGGGRVLRGRGEDREEVDLGYPTGIRAEWGAFVDRIRSGRAQRNTPGEALADVRVVLALLRSAETGAWVRPSDL